jgi:hypothetical protein
VPIADDGREALRLMPALEERGAEVDVVEVQRAAVRVDVDALHAALFTRLPRQVVFEVLRDRQPAQDRVAELVAAQLPGRRHHPPHPEQRAELFGVAAVVVGRRPPAATTPASMAWSTAAIWSGRAAAGRAAMDVVGRDAQRRAESRG